MKISELNKKMCRVLVDGYTVDFGKFKCRDGICSVGRTRFKKSKIKSTHTDLKSITSITVSSVIDGDE